MSNYQGLERIKEYVRIKYGSSVEFCSYKKEKDLKDPLINIMLETSEVAVEIVEFRLIDDTEFFILLFSYPCGVKVYESYFDRLTHHIKDVSERFFEYGGIFDDESCDTGC